MKQRHLKASLIKHLDKLLFCWGILFFNPCIAPVLLSSFSQAGWIAFLTQLCSEASLPKKAMGDLCLCVYTVNWTLQAVIFPLSIMCERFHLSLSSVCSSSRGFIWGYGGSRVEISVNICLLMVLEIRLWMHCLSGTQGVRKQVDCIKERWEINTQSFWCSGTAQLQDWKML